MKNKKTDVVDADPPVTAIETKKCVDLLQKFFMQKM
jgi:hypothetical protein